MDVYPCKHDIWIYEGSYHSVCYEPWDDEREYRTLFEDSSWRYADFAFKHNKYICLECHKRVETKNWQDFEKTHFVLKNQNENNNLSFSYYLNLYYQLLFNNGIEQAQKMLIEEFEKNKEKQAAQILKTKKR